jgi:hypothetical protein
MYNDETTLRKYEPPWKPLITFTGAASGTPQKRFQVPIPDSRLRVKISVIFVPDPGLPPDAGSGAVPTIWLYEAEKDRSGATGINIPCTNIEGTQAVPTAFGTAGLGGYSREFVSAADYIEGVVAATFGSGAFGSFVLQCRYQPNAVRFTDQEWNKITNACSPRVMGGAFVI